MDRCLPQYQLIQDLNASVWIVSVCLLIPQCVTGERLMSLHACFCATSRHPHPTVNHVNPRLITCTRVSACYQSNSRPDVPTIILPLVNLTKERTWDAICRLSDLVFCAVDPHRLLLPIPDDHVLIDAVREKFHDLSLQ